VVAVNTLRALRAAGHECVVVAPFDPAREDGHRLTGALRDFCEPHLVPAAPRSIAVATWLAGVRGVPLTIGRHALTTARQTVERLLSERPFDVVHAEQLQALAQCDPAHRHSVPIVLRSQNVESELWSAWEVSWPLLAPIVRRESARLARYEGRAVRRVAATIALTERDAERLRALSGRTVGIDRVAAPFPRQLPPAGAALAGEPAVVVLTSRWFPNRDGAAWFCRTVWPEVRGRCPRAILHLFGAVRGVRSERAVVVHAEPADSREAFPPGAILAVPLRIASGVRVKILESWARGVPVVATPEAAAGLDATDGKELLIAPDPRGFAAAIARLHADASLVRALVAAGRMLLGTRHDPARIAERLALIYADAAHRVDKRVTEAS
jgi:Glycosyl transferases group 1/Glycosyl transferase 4-like domain